MIKGGLHMNVVKTTRTGARPVVTRRRVVVGRHSVRVQAVSTPVAVPAPASSNGKENGAAAQSQPSAAPAPTPPVPNALPPKATFGAVLKASQMKANMKTDTLFVLGIAAGALIGFGALLMNNVGGSSPALMAANPGACNFLKGAVGLPTGLFMVVITGAELFTGNVMVMLSGLLAKTVQTADLVRNWVVSYAGNLVGSLLLACIATVGQVPTAAITKVAATKAALPFTVCVAKGIMCNWLVCLAVWGAMASNTVAGKAAAIFLPISAFIALGLEHSVANMFLLPCGKMMGADVTWKQIFANNILPVTIGNVLGAAVFVAGIHYFAYGRE